MARTTFPLKDCRSWDHQAGIICSLSSKHGERHQLPAQPSGRRSPSRLSQHPLCSSATKVKALKVGWTIFKVFSNLSDSMILIYDEKFMLKHNGIL